MSVVGVINGTVSQGDTGRRAQIAVVSKSLTPVSVAANVTAAQNLTMDAGDAAIGDIFLPIAGAQQAGVLLEQVGPIVTADTLPALFGNGTAGALVPTAGVYTFLRFRF